MTNIYLIGISLTTKNTKESFVVLRALRG